MRGTSAGVKTTDLENTINLMLVYRNDSFQTNIDSMTIDVVFMAKNKVVFRVNMCYSNFASKILDEQPIEERWIPGFDGDNQTGDGDNLLIKGLSKRFGTHAFDMGIFQKIMTSWES